MIDLNPAERAAIEARHVRIRSKNANVGSYADPDWCAADAQEWPCDAARLLAALRAAEGRALPSVGHLCPCTCCSGRWRVDDLALRCDGNCGCTARLSPSSAALATGDEL
mgnify:CR=1 FL=1